MAAPSSGLVLGGGAVFLSPRLRSAMTLNTPLYPVASAGLIQRWWSVGLSELAYAHAVPAATLTWGLVAVFLVGMPVADSLPFIGTYDSQRLCEIALFLWAAGLMMLSEERAHGGRLFQALPRRAHWGLGLVFALGVASALLAPRPRYALLEVSSFLLMGVLAVHLASFFQRHRTEPLRLVKPVLVLGTMAYLTVFLVGHAQALVVGGSLWPRALPGFAHVRMFNQWQVWVMPLLIAFVALAPKRRERWGLRILLAGMVMLLIASGGRGATLALVGSSLLIGALYRRAASAWLREAALAAGLGGAMYLLFFRVLASGNLSVLDRAGLGTSGRDLLWAKALHLIAEHPVFGYGPMHFAYDPSPLAAHPHNLVLQWATEWGLPAAIILLGLLGWGGVAWLRRTRSAVYQGAPESLWLMGLTSALSASLANALVDGSVIAPLSQVGWAVLGALLLAAYSGMDSGQRPPSTALKAGANSKLGWMGRLVVAAAALVMVTNMSLDVPTLHRRDYDYRAVRFSRMAPLRFWSQGRIADVEDPAVIRRVEQLARELAADR
ncbi:MAG: O-antigen ligase family protein [Rhodothermaceae bacterium]|nr:O-antigen ligase family protein [Rhodothermaceae bacterium]